MDLTFLGSAAAEAWPALFCTCESCEGARKLGGRNIRRRTSYRLGEHTHIDWGPDTCAACLALGLDMASVTDLIVTHNHSDHFTPHELYFRRPGYSLVPEDRVLSVYGPAGVGEVLGEKFDDPAVFRLGFSELAPFVETPVNPDCSVTALPATHGVNIGGAFTYILRTLDSGRTVLIGHDTGWYDQEVWDFLAGKSLDAVIMDTTYGFRAERRHHLGCPDVVEVKQVLQESGALAPDCRFIANHFSHNGLWLYDQLVEYFAPHGIEVGYDGMIVTL
ncbi:MAG: hypothetical protein HPY44_06190 [Armatimonadetes bacterium]|nr:hypothetical protein [Armatimonadota bacterium]